MVTKVVDRSRTTLLVICLFGLLIIGALGRCEPAPSIEPFFGPLMVTAEELIGEK